jgi:hypothetical protein
VINNDDASSVTLANGTYIHTDTGSTVTLSVGEAAIVMDIGESWVYASEL